MQNLAELVLDRAGRRPDARFGMADQPLVLSDAVARARQLASVLASAGVSPGSRVALVGETSTEYLLGWLALVLAGAEPALVNPSYPASLLVEMLADLEPAAVVWTGRAPERDVAAGAVHLETADLADSAGGGPFGDPPGLGRQPLDVAGYMHTSGTTGVPKFCVQTHEYFLRLGRFIADSFCLSAADTVFAPLPMFHINPLGYGVIGGLTGGADVLGTSRFSASGFWPAVHDIGATALVLHAPPVEILKRATTADDAAGHRVSRVFFADADFLDTFAVPLGFSAYGSTEAGGLSHVWAWRIGDRPDLPEGMSRYGGRARHDVEWRVNADGEIAVRGLRPGVLFSGYRRRTGLVAPFDADGWFATGDIGRVDEAGNLVFVERRAESIRVRGEYVPIGYVEQRFAEVDDLADLALWRRKSELVDDEVVLFVVADHLDLEPLRQVSATLPRFMRPSAVARMASIPRDAAVGKVQRRLLDVADAVEVVTL
jgi:crotonobetaine/carnitine-CoA ligase